MKGERYNMFKDNKIVQALRIIKYQIDLTDAASEQLGLSRKEGRAVLATLQLGAAHKDEIIDTHAIIKALVAKSKELKDVDG